jgi:choline-sulfatase
MATPINTELREDTYPNHLRRAGYRTSLVGKHHWIDNYGLFRDVKDDDELIRRYGFDDVLQVLDEMEGVLFNEDELTSHLRNVGRLEQYREQAKKQANRAGPFEMPESDYADRFIADHACRWLKEEAPHDQPWYLNVSFVGPHPPLWHPGDCDLAPEDVPLFVVGAEKTPMLSQKRAHFLQKCILIDRYIGNVLAALDARGQRENTLIVFTSDHGDMLGDFGIWDKRHFNEQSIGVPLIMAGPGVPRGDRDLGGQIRRDLVSHLDLYPTF